MEIIKAFDILCKTLWNDNLAGWKFLYRSIIFFSNFIEQIVFYKTEFIELVLCTGFIRCTSSTIKCEVPHKISHKFLVTYINKYYYCTSPPFVTPDSSSWSILFFKALQASLTHISIPCSWVSGNGGGGFLPKLNRCMAVTILSGVNTSLAYRIIMNSITAICALWIKIKKCQIKICTY